MSKITEQHYDEGGWAHRIGGPAIVHSDGSMFWYRHGKHHRRGGPAEAWLKFWYVNGYDLRAPRKLPERAHPIMELFL